MPVLGREGAPQRRERALVAELAGRLIESPLPEMLDQVEREHGLQHRHLHLQAVLAATGVTLCVCTAWGFLASFAGVPAPGMEYVFVIFNVALFIGEGVITWRQR